MSQRYYLLTSKTSVFRVDEDGQKERVFTPSRGKVLIDAEKLMAFGYGAFYDHNHEIDPDSIRLPIPVEDLCHHKDYNGDTLGADTYLPGNDTPPNLLYLNAQAAAFAAKVNQPSLFRAQSIRKELQDNGINLVDDEEAVLHEAVGERIAVKHTLDLMDVIYLDFATLCGNLDPDDRIRVFMNSGQHAREWLSQKCFFRFIQVLMATFWQVSREDIRARADHPLRRYVFILIPVLNPLGFFATTIQSDADRPITTEWDLAQGPYDQRQNRKKSRSGVDLNRNAAVLHGALIGSSNDPDDECYAGPFAESEIEMYAVSCLLRLDAYRPDVGADWHSYSDVILVFPSFDLGAMLAELIYSADGDKPYPTYDTAFTGKVHERFRDYMDARIVDEDEIRAFLEQLAGMEYDDPADPMKRASEVAQMALFHYGERAKKNMELSRRLCTFLEGFSVDANEVLGYQAVGAFSDFLYVKLGAAIGGGEIGSVRSTFAADDLDGQAHQLAFPYQLYRFFLDAKTQEDILEWKEIRAPRDGAEMERMDFWRNFSG